MKANKIDIAIGKRIRAIRELRGMTMANLAVKVGVTYQQVHKYETGVNRVAASTLYLIAKALQITPANFFIEIEE